VSSILKKELKHGTVVDTDGKKIVVVLDKHCSESTECRTGCGACGGNSKIQKTTIFTDSAQHYTVGQKIEFSRVVLNEALNALIVFGIPLFFALCNIVVWYFISPATVNSPLAMILTATAFLLGFLVVWCIDYRFHKKHPARIIQTLEHSFKGGIN